MKYYFQQKRSQFEDCPLHCSFVDQALSLRRMSSFINIVAIQRLIHLTINIKFILITLLIV